MFFRRWIDEGLAEIASCDGKVNKTQINTLISMPAIRSYLNGSLPIV
jgi:hypothetical protein